jgi:cardiolipin synthase
MTSFLFLAIPIVEWGIRIVMTMVILRRGLPPVTALAWLTVIFFLPLVGLPVYLLVGVSYLGQRRVRSHRRVAGRAQSRVRLDLMKNHALRPEMGQEQEAMIAQAQRMSGNLILGGNAVELLSDTVAYIDRLVADIDAAQHHVNLLYYIWRPDALGVRVVEAVIRAQQRGVVCRLLVDAVGSKPLLKSAQAAQLRKAGGHVVPMLPVRLWRRKLARMDLRNHRKIAVIDGAVAYAGSHNLVVEDYGHRRAGKWIDLSARFTGPITAQLQIVFLEDWEFETDERLDFPELFPSPVPSGEVPAQVVPTGPNHPSDSFQRVLLAALNSARRKIIMTTPYLVPDEPTMVALSMAADRGVEVRIATPRRSDHPLVGAAGRAYYEQLMEVGVHIHRCYAGLLHAKTITVDDNFALLGSANLDIRSFYLNFEINVLLYGPQITGRLRFAQQDYLAQAEQLSLESWRQRPALRQYTEAAAALLSPLL